MAGRGKGYGGDDCELGGDGWRSGEVTWVTSLHELHVTGGDRKVNREIFFLSQMGIIGLESWLRLRMRTEKTLPFVYRFFTEIGL